MCLGGGGGGGSVVFTNSYILKSMEAKDQRPITQIVLPGVKLERNVHSQLHEYFECSNIQFFNQRGFGQRNQPHPLYLVL